MIITEKKLRRMIQNALLKEDEDLPPFVIKPMMDIEPDGVFTSRDLPGGIPSYVTGDYKPSSGGMSAEEAQLYAEIMAGFTPAGIAVDAKDIAVALGEGDWWGAALATAGLIPGVGEAKKIKKLMDLKDVKKLDKVDQDALTNLKNNIENIKDVDVNELEKSIEKAQSAIKTSSVISKGSRVIRGVEKIKDSLKGVIKNDGTVYHVHTINRSEFTDDVLDHGVALRKNRSGSGYRATTYNNDMGSATIDQLRSAPFGIGTNNKVTVIYELPPGKSLKDIVVPFKGVQRDSRYGKFVGNISNEYLKAYVDRRGADDVMKILR